MAANRAGLRVPGNARQCSLAPELFGTSAQRLPRLRGNNSKVKDVSVGIFQRKITLQRTITPEVCNLKFFSKSEAIPIRSRRCNAPPEHRSVQHSVSETIGQFSRFPPRRRSDVQKINSFCKSEVAVVKRSRFGERGGVHFPFNPLKQVSPFPAAVHRARGNAQNARKLPMVVHPKRPVTRKTFNANADKDVTRNDPEQKAQEGTTVKEKIDRLEQCTSSTKDDSKTATPKHNTSIFDRMDIPDNFSDTDFEENFESAFQELFGNDISNIRNSHKLKSNKPKRLWDKYTKETTVLRSCLSNLEQRKNPCITKMTRCRSHININPSRPFMQKGGRIHRNVSGPGFQHDQRTKEKCSINDSVRGKISRSKPYDVSQGADPVDFLSRSGEILEEASHLLSSKTGDENNRLSSPLRSMVTPYEYLASPNFMSHSNPNLNKKSSILREKQNEVVSPENYRHVSFKGNSDVRERQGRVPMPRKNLSFLRSEGSDTVSSSLSRNALQNRKSACNKESVFGDTMCDDPKRTKLKIPKCKRRATICQTPQIPSCAFLSPKELKNRNLTKGNNDIIASLSPNQTNAYIHCVNIEPKTSSLKVRFDKYDGSVGLDGTHLNEPLSSFGRPRKKKFDQRKKLGVSASDLNNIYTPKAAASPLSSRKKKRGRDDSKLTKKRQLRLEQAMRDSIHCKSVPIHRRDDLEHTNAPTRACPLVLTRREKCMLWRLLRENEGVKRKGNCNAFGDICNSADRLEKTGYSHPRAKSATSLRHKNSKVSHECLTRNALLTDRLSTYSRSGSVLTENASSDYKTTRPFKSVDRQDHYLRKENERGRKLFRTYSLTGTANRYHGLAVKSGYTEGLPHVSKQKNAKSRCHFSKKVERAKPKRKMGRKSRRNLRGKSRFLQPPAPLPDEHLHPYVKNASCAPKTAPARAACTCGSPSLSRVVPSRSTSWSAGRKCRLAGAPPRQASLLKRDRVLHSRVAPSHGISCRARPSSSPTENRGAPRRGFALQKLWSCDWSPSRGKTIRWNSVPPTPPAHPRRSKKSGAASGAGSGTWSGVWSGSGSWPVLGSGTRSGVGSVGSMVRETPPLSPGPKATKMPKTSKVSLTSNASVASRVSNDSLGSRMSKATMASLMSNASMASKVSNASMTSRMSKASMASRMSKASNETMVSIMSKRSKMFEEPRALACRLGRAMQAVASVSGARAGVVGGKGVGAEAEGGARPGCPSRQHNTNSTPQSPPMVLAWRLGRTLKDWLSHQQLTRSHSDWRKDFNCY